MVKELMERLEKQREMRKTLTNEQLELADDIVGTLWELTQNFELRCAYNNDHNDETLATVGTWFSSEPTLADRTHNFIPNIIKGVDIPKVADDDSTEDIFGYFGQEMPTGEDEIDLRNEALDLLNDAYLEARDSAIAQLSDWIWEFEKIYGVIERGTYELEFIEEEEQEE